MSDSLTREQVERTLNLIVDHSLRCWKSSDEVQMILDHDAALRAEVQHYREACQSVGETDGHGWAETTKNLREQLVEAMNDNKRMTVNWSQEKARGLELEQQLAQVEQCLTRLSGEEMLPVAEIVQRDLEQYRKELGETRQQLAQVQTQLATVTAERDEAMKWKGHHDHQVELKQRLHGWYVAVLGQLAERDVSIGNLQDEILKLDHHILERDATIKQLSEELQSWKSGSRL
jgi:chromosome segregation ATPase